MKNSISKKAMAIIVSLGILITCLSSGLIVSAARNSAHTAENFEHSMLWQYYGGTSNANSYYISGNVKYTGDYSPENQLDVKYKNYDTLYNETTTRKHVALPYREEGVGHDGSNSVMKLIYVDNYGSDQLKYNPGFSIMDVAGGTNQSHQPVKNTTLYVSFWYKAVNIPATTNLYIAGFGASLTNAKLAVTDTTNYVVMATITEASDGWVHVYQKYTAPNSNMNLIIFMDAPDKENCGGTEVLIDDISIDRVDNTITIEDGGQYSSWSSYVGYPLDLPNDAAKSGYTFDGWYLDAEFTQPVTSNTLCTGNMTVYGKWAEIDTNISGVVQDFETVSSLVGKGNPALTSEENHTDGGSKSVKFSVTDYKTNDATPWVVVSKPDGSQALMEKGKTYLIDFWVMAADDIPDTTGGLQARIFSRPKTGDSTFGSSKNEYEYKDVGCLTGGDWTNFRFSFTVAGVADYDKYNLTLGIVAKSGTYKGTFTYYVDDISVQEYVPHVVDFNSNGGTSVASVSGLPGTSISAGTPFRVGHTFEGWYFDNSVWENEASIIPDSDATAYAKWTPVAGSTVQTYEDYEAKSYAADAANGIHGNGSGRTVSEDFAYSGTKSVKLNMNWNHTENNAATILKQGTDNADIRVAKGGCYKVTFWAYSEEDLIINFRLGTYNTNVGISGVSGYMYNEEAFNRVALVAGVWTKITLVAPSINGTTKGAASDYLAITATFGDQSENIFANPKYVYLDDVDVSEHEYSAGDLDFDGSVTVHDMPMMQDYLLGKLDDICFTKILTTYHDVNADEIANIADYVRMKKQIVSAASAVLQNSGKDDNSIAIG